MAEVRDEVAPALVKDGSDLLLGNLPHRLPEPIDARSRERLADDSPDTVVLVGGHEREVPLTHELQDRWRRAPCFIVFNRSWRHSGVEERVSANVVGHEFDAVVANSGLRAKWTTLELQRWVQVARVGVRDDPRQLLLVHRRSSQTRRSPARPF